MDTLSALKKIEKELERNATYMKVLDVLPSCGKIRARDYYKGRTEALEKMKSDMEDI